MASTISALHIRRELGRKEWAAPVPFGPDGWTFTSITGKSSVIVTVADFDGAEWVHASIACRDHMPEYSDLVALHKAVFGDGYAYQVFAPSAQHVNIYKYALHLWGRLDGTPVMPEFGAYGSI